MCASLTLDFFGAAMYCEFIESWRGLPVQRKLLWQCQPQLHSVPYICYFTAGLTRYHWLPSEYFHKHAVSKTLLPARWYISLTAEVNHRDHVYAAYVIWDGALCWSVIKPIMPAMLHCTCTQTKFRKYVATDVRKFVAFACTDTCSAASQFSLRRGIKVCNYSHPCMHSYWW
jgi:hypothetical protein